jgi:hypothetical protein
MQSELKEVKNKFRGKKTSAFTRANMFVEHVRGSLYTGIPNREHVRTCKKVTRQKVT